MAEKIEKKISRVMKWLERCASSCRGESYGSALMDIECARVDFDSARDEIWNAAHKQCGPSVRKIYFMKIFRSVAAAAVILLFAAAPVSFTEDTFSDIAAADGSSLEWLNPDEKALLKNLREQLSGANYGLASDITDFVTVAPVSVSALSAVYSEPAEAQKAEEPPKGRNAKPERAAVSRELAEEQPLRSVKADIKKETQIFTLIKIGENALRNKPSAVMIER